MGKSTHGRGLILPFGKYPDFVSDTARSQGFDLPHSLIEVRCASMASFRPNGWLYDGRGIEVDIEVHPDPTYFIEGGQDKVLERAIERLKKSR